MAVKAKQLTVKIPWIGELTFIADEAQQRAAWALYVELNTRIAVQPLNEDHGLLREALDSLYSIFVTTQRILIEAGPDVADGESSFGPIAIRVLNEGLRPFLSKWHPLLKAHESTRSTTVDILEHERAWIIDGVNYNELMRSELAELQVKISAYADVLAQISGAKDS